MQAATPFSFLAPMSSQEREQAEKDADDWFSANGYPELIRDFVRELPLLDVEKHIINLVLSVGKIMAIKWCREHFGEGLKEAKDRVELVMNIHNIVSFEGQYVRVVRK
jgi:hypothetical protein